MKKIYVKPGMQAKEIKAATLICLSRDYDNHAIKGNEVLGKDRGSRSSDDDFDDLW